MTCNLFQVINVKNHLAFAWSKILASKPNEVSIRGQLFLTWIHFTISSNLEKLLQSYYAVWSRIKIRFTFEMIDQSLLPLPPSLCLSRSLFLSRKLWKGVSCFKSRHRRGRRCTWIWKMDSGMRVRSGSSRAIRLRGNLIYVNINSRSLAEFCVIRRNEFLGGRVLQV